VQNSGSSVLWLGATLAVIWLVGAHHSPLTLSVDAFLAKLTAMLPTIF
jgi:hypothetical protein